MAFEKFRLDGEEIEPESLTTADTLIKLSQGRNTSGKDKTFACKTCDRRFSSFQALGGHRAGHKRPKSATINTKASKVHECNICGQEFSIGQALGGHMRRHRTTNEGIVDAPLQTVEKVMKQQRVISNSCFDLNLSPWENEKMKSREITFNIV